MCVNVSGRSSVCVHMFMCFYSLCVWVCVVSVVTGQTRQQQTHPYKTGGEPSFLLINLAPPPVLVGSVQHLYDVPGLKRQLPVCHGHMVPYRLSVYDRTSTYQLEELEWKKKKAVTFPLPSVNETLAMETPWEHYGYYYRCLIPKKQTNQLAKVDCNLFVSTFFLCLKWYKSLPLNPLRLVMDGNTHPQVRAHWPLRDFKENNTMANTDHSTAQENITTQKRKCN